MCQNGTITPSDLEIQVSSALYALRSGTWADTLLWCRSASDKKSNSLVYVNMGRGALRPPRNGSRRGFTLTQWTKLKVD